MKARSLLIILTCAILITLFFQPVLGNVARDPSEEGGAELVTEQQQLRLMNEDFKTIGDVGTYEEYTASRTFQPFEAGHLSRGPGAPEFFDNAVLVLVELDIYNIMNTEIATYTSDLKAQGYSAPLITVSGGTAEDLKDTILSYYNNASYNVVGASLIGDLPTAWFYHANDFSGPDTFPCDLFLMDMDGTWTDANSDNKYESHTDGTGDTAPEIFIGRIDASNVPGVELTVLQNYFDKVHRFWTNQINRSYKALTYTDKDWAGGWSFLNDISFAYDDYQALAWPSVDKNDYVNNRLPNTTYEFIQLSCHSGSSMHYFDQGGTVSSTGVRNAGPEALFYNLYCCSGARFTDYNCLGYAYVMDTDTDSLASVGSTKTGSMLAFSQFYNPLGKGNSFGEAFRQWFESQAPYSDDPGGYNDISWYYGMTILGDPTLILFRPDIVYVDDDYGPATSGWQTTHFADLNEGIAKVNGGGQVRVFEGTYQGPIYINRTVSVIAEPGPEPVIACPASGAPGVIINDKNFTLLGFKIIGNLTQPKGTGVLVGADDAVVNSCNISGTATGLILDRAVSATLAQNTIDGGIYLTGDSPQHYDSHSIDLSNFVDGRSIQYRVGLQGAGIPMSAGQVILVSCSNVTVNGLDLYDCYAPLQMYYSNGCKISNSSIKNSRIGALVKGDGNYFTDNLVKNNTLSALWIVNGQGNIIVHNNFENNNPVGKQAKDEGSANVFDNGAEGNYWSDWTGPDGDGNGIVDAPYYLEGGPGNKDNYPLTKPWGIPVLVWDQEYYVLEDELYIANFSVMNTNEYVFWYYEANTEFTTLHPNGSLMGVPTNDDVGDWWVNVSIESASGADFVNFTLYVENVNDPPEILDNAPTALVEDELFFHTFTATDIDPTEDVMSWSLDTNSSFLSIDLVTGNLSGRPANEDVGSWWINVTADDNKGGTDSLNYTIIVKNANDPPKILTTPVLYCPQGEYYNMTFAAADPDPTGDDLVWKFTTDGSDFLDFDTGQARVFGTPGNDHVGEWFVNATVSDGNGGSDSLFYILVVNNTNDAPFGAQIILENNYFENEPGRVIGTAQDADIRYGDVLTYSWYANGIFKGTGADVFLDLEAGNWTLELNVTDSAGSWCTAVELIVVEPEPVEPPEDDDAADDDVADDDVVDDDAADDDEDDDDGESGLAGGMMALIFIIVLIIALVLIVAIIVLVLLLRRSSKEDEEEDEQPHEEDASYDDDGYGDDPWEDENDGYDDPYDDYDDGYGDYEERHFSAPPPPVRSKAPASIEWEDGDDDLDDDDDDDEEDMFSLDDTDDYEDDLYDEAPQLDEGLEWADDDNDDEWL